MPTSYSIPEVYEQEIEGVIKAGYYSNKSEVVREALRDFFERKKQLRISAGIELYKRGKVTLSRAAEIAGMNFFEFKDLLIEKGIKIISPGGTREELERGVQLIKKLRNKK